MSNTTSINNLKLLLQIDNKTFYNIDKTLSYIAFLYIIFGGRGIGKTTQLILWCLNRRINFGEEFIYLRRYKPEVKLQRKLLNKYCNGVKVVGDGNGGWIYSWNEHILGYCIALSQASNYKSVEFENVRNIIYDEAIISPSSRQYYIKDEVTALFEFMSTVIRLRNARVFVLGNNLNYFNPYCQYFDVPLFKDIYYDKERGLYIHYAKDNPVLRAIEENTPLYKLTKGTAYHEYHYNNMVLTDKIVKCVNKRNNDKLLFRCILKKYTLNCYVRDNKNLLFECKTKIINDGLTYIIFNNDNDINYAYADMFKLRWIKLVRYKYGNEECEFTNQDAQMLVNMLLDMFD